MPPLNSIIRVIRGRKWIFPLLAISTLFGCIRFRSDAPPDASVDAGAAGGAPDGENDASTSPEGGDVFVPPAPVCSRFNPNAVQALVENIAGDLITEVAVNDCTLRRHFANLPPIAVTHLQECLAAQIGQVMGCHHPNGEPFRYPTNDSTGRFCRDMKGSHMGLTISDGDFDAFIADFDKALEHNELTEEERMRVLGVFGATRADIVRLKDAGPTKSCDAPDAEPDTN